MPGHTRRGGRATKEGRRNAAGDLAKIQDIHDAAAFLGADCAPAKAKSIAPAVLASLAAFTQRHTQAADAVKGFDYAAAESWDIQRAASCVNVLAQIAADEAYHEEGDDVQELAKIMKALLAFIQGELQEMVDAAVEAAAVEAAEEAAEAAFEAAPEPAVMSADKTLVAFGAEVKALGAGRVGGYLVRFGDATKTDLTGDYFTPETDFGPHTTSLVYYQHGMDGALKRRVLDNSAALRKDDVGVWVEAQLDLRNEYEQEIYKMASAGKLGWSSGTASHLVERERDGKAMRITAWPLGLDASLTPTPAEPRTSVVPLKSLISEQSGSQLPPATVAEAAHVEASREVAERVERARRHEQLLKAYL